MTERLHVNIGRDLLITSSQRIRISGPAGHNTIMTSILNKYPTTCSNEKFPEAIFRVYGWKMYVNVTTVSS